MTPGRPLRVLESLSGEPPEALRVIGRALSLAGGPLGYFGGVLDVLADELEDTQPPRPGRLSPLQMSYYLRRLRRDPELPALLERLEDATEQPWVALREALTGS